MSRKTALVSLVVALLLLAGCSSAATPAAKPEAPAPAPKAEAPAPAPKAEAPAPVPKVEVPAPAKPAAKPLTQMRGRISTAVLQSSTLILTAGVHPKLRFYQDEGIDGDWSGAESATQTLGLVTNQQVEFGALSPENLVDLAAKGQELPVQFVYLYSRRNNTELAVKPDSPLKQPADLKGKKIGVNSLGASESAYVKTAIRLAGGDPEKDVEFIAVGQGATAAQALDKGQVDALAFAISLLTTMENQGFKLRYLPKPEFDRDLFGQGLVVNKEYLKAHRQEVIGFARAIAKMTVFALANPEAAVRLFYEVHPENLQKGKTDAENVADGLKIFETRIPGFEIGANDRDKRWGAYTPQGWDFFLDFREARGKVKNVGDLYTNDLIDEINKFDQKAIQEMAKSFKF